MDQQLPLSENEILPLPGFHDETDLFGDEPASADVTHRGRRRSLIIVASVLLVIVLGGIILGVVNNRRSRIAYQFQKVIQGDLTLAVNATGPLQTDVYNLNFTGTGKLTEIDVEVGQKVEDGQTLARLDPATLQNALNESQASVTSAQTSLSNAQANYSAAASAASVSVSAAQSALNDAMANLKEVHTQSQATIAAAQTTLDDAQTNLGKVQAQSQAAIDSAQTTLKNAQTNLTDVEAQTQAEVQVAYNQEQQTIATCNGNSTCIANAEDLYAQAQAQAAGQVATAQNQVDAAQSALNTAKVQAAAQDNAAQSQINAAQSALSTAQAQAGTQSTTAQNQVNAAQKQLTTAQAQGNVQTTSSLGQVNMAQSQLSTAQTQLATAEYNLTNTTLKAPHKGTVVAVNGTVGGTPGVVAGTTAGVSNIFVQIVDLSVLQVQASVNEADIGGIAIGDTVHFSVSAYGDHLFKGTVRAIAPLGQTVSNVVTYPVLIDVDTSSLSQVNLLPGMTASVTIVTQKRSHVLQVPVSAVNFVHIADTPDSNNGNRILVEQSQVNNGLTRARQMLQELQQGGNDLSKENPIPVVVLERVGNQNVVKPIVVGLTDGTSYEVLAGLSANDVVIIGTQNQSGGGFFGSRSANGGN